MLWKSYCILVMLETTVDTKVLRLSQIVRSTSADMKNHPGAVYMNHLCADIISLYRSIAPVEAVQGNVDDDVTEEELPTIKFLVIEGWRILIIHILPKIDLPVRSSRSVRHHDHTTIGKDHGWIPRGGYAACRSGNLFWQSIDQILSYTDTAINTVSWSQVAFATAIQDQRGLHVLSFPEQLQFCTSNPR